MLIKTLSLRRINGPRFIMLPVAAIQRLFKCLSMQVLLWMLGIKTIQPRCISLQEKAIQ